MPGLEEAVVGVQELGLLEHLGDEDGDAHLSLLAIDDPKDG